MSDDTGIVMKVLQRFFGTESKTQLNWLLAEAAKWQPKGYKARVKNRLDYLDGNMRNDLLAVLQEEFEATWTHMQRSIITLPIVAHIIKKKSTVFEGNGRYFLVDKKTREEIKPDDKAALAWSDIIRESLVEMALKRSDQVTEQNHSAGLKVWWDKDHVTVSAFTPDKVDIVVNPARELDAYSARAVLFERTGAGGLRDNSRFEVWGDADPTLPKPKEGFDSRTYEPTIHFITDGKNTWAVNDKDENPFKDDDGKAVVPFAWLTDNRESLYRLGGDHLVAMNRIVNWGLTYLHHAMNWMSLGIPTFEKNAGSNAKLPENRIVSPKHALALPPDVKFSFIRNDIDLGAITSTYELMMQYHAMLSGIDPANISVKQFSAKSGFAIKLEMSGLGKHREMKIPLYRPNVIHLMRIIKIVHNYYAPKAKKEKIPDHLDPDWSPGEVDAGPIDYIQLGQRYQDEIEYNVSTVDDWAADVHGVDKQTAKGIVEKNTARNAETVGKSARFPDEPTGGGRAVDEIKKLTAGGDEPPPEGEPEE